MLRWQSSRPRFCELLLAGSFGFDPVARRLGVLDELVERITNLSRLSDVQVRAVVSFGDPVRDASERLRRLAQMSLALDEDPDPRACDGAVIHFDARRRRLSDS